MKQDKSHKSNSAEDPNKKKTAFLLAKINGRYIIIAAVITGFFVICAALITATTNAHFELGKTYTYQKEWRDAVRQFDFILEHKPRNFDIETVKDSRKFALSMIE